MASFLLRKGQKLIGSRIVCHVLGAVEAELHLLLAEVVESG
jgi:hypothetical protein